MSISILAQGNALSNMRALLALLITQAGTLEPASAKLLKCVRSIGRLIRAIIDVEVMIYQSRMLSNMLSDPAWRARVLAGFGGYAGLVAWQKRYRRAFQKQHNCRDGMAAAPRDTSLSSRPSPTDSKPRAKRESRSLSDPIFVLPPMPRAFHGRVKRTHIARPSDPILPRPLHAPIIVTPYELTVRRGAAQYGPPPETGSAGGVTGGATPQDPDPP